MVKRHDIDLRELHGSTIAMHCADCGMGLISAREFHPIEACDEFKRSHDPRTVLELLAREVEDRQKANYPRKITRPVAS
jgi:hypothetical protein